MSKKILAAVLLVLFIILVVAIFEMPALGSLDHPAYNETAKYYIDNAIEDTNSPNIITAIITDYRAFDTLGETTVLFTSIAAVASILSVTTKKGDDK
jgi:multicomponent Na+:H+ antiporter subunit B